MCHNNKQLRSRKYTDLQTKFNNFYCTCDTIRLSQRSPTRSTSKSKKESVLGQYPFTLKLKKITIVELLLSAYQRVDSELVRGSKIYQITEVKQILTQDLQCIGRVMEPNME